MKNQNQLEEQVRKLIRENIFAAAVPDFVMIQSLDHTTRDLRNALQKYIQMYHSNSDQERFEAEEAAEEMLKDFRESTRAVFHDCLEDFLRRIGR